MENVILNYSLEGRARHGAASVKGWTVFSVSLFAPIPVLLLPLRESSLSGVSKESTSPFTRHPRAKDEPLPLL